MVEEESRVYYYYVLLQHLLPSSVPLKCPTSFLLSHGCVLGTRLVNEFLVLVAIMNGFPFRGSAN